MHGARAALRDTAAKFRAVHAQFLAHNPQDRHVGIGVDLDRLAVQRKFCHVLRLLSLLRHAARLPQEAPQLRYAIYRTAWRSPSTILSLGV